MNIKNKQRAKLALAELEKELEIVAKEEMNTCKGGGYGTFNSPWTPEEFQYLGDLGICLKGYVESPNGPVYAEILAGVTVVGNSTGNIFEGMDIQNKQYMYEKFQAYSSGYYEPSYEYGFGGSGGGDNQGGISYYDHEPTVDGINLNNKNFTFNTVRNSAFDKQLKDILSTNNTIKGLLSYFDRGIVHMTFGIKNLGQNTAHIKYASPESYHINFNSNRINQNGFHWNPTTDNIGYDYSKTRNDMERLVVVIAHEAIHAKHYATFQDAQRKMGDRNANAVANNLLNRGYSQEFVEIFFIKDNQGEWKYNYDGNNVNDRAHNYMRKYNHSVIDKALEEYRRDKGL